MKIGDYVKYRDEMIILLFEDLEGDLWFEMKNYKEDFDISGEFFIEEIGNNECIYLDEDYLHFIKKSSYYQYIEESFEIPKKINLTKLARKMYNIPEDFTGDFYKVTEV